MSNEHLEEVLNQLSQVTNIILETSKIKDNFNKSKGKKDVNSLLKDTKTQVDALTDRCAAIKDLFYNHCYKNQDNTVLNGFSNGDLEHKDTNGIPSDSEDPLGNVEPVGPQTKIPLTKPLIKVVDIRKLVEHPNKIIKPESPSPKKQVHFDTTIVNISSSDDEVPVVQIKKNPHPTKKVVLKVKRVKPNQKVVHTSSEESSVEVKSRPKRSTRNKTPQTKVITLSDTSDFDSEQSDSGTKKQKDKSKDKLSSLDSEKSSSDLEKASTKSKTEEADNNNIPQLDLVTDKKINSKCVVNLPRIPCEKLKEYYLDKLDLLEINRLTNMDTLKRKRNQKSNSTESNSEDDKARSNKIRKKVSDKTDDMIDDPNDSDATASLAEEGTVEAPNSDDFNKDKEAEILLVMK